MIFLPVPSMILPVWDGWMGLSVELCCLRHRENFWAFSGPRTNFGLILLKSNMVIHWSFTGPTHVLSANVWGPVSFAVSAVYDVLPLRLPAVCWYMVSDCAIRKLLPVPCGLTSLRQANVGYEKYSLHLIFTFYLNRDTSVLEWIPVIVFK